MKTLKVSDLQPGPQMNHLVAEARGWALRKAPYLPLDIEQHGRWVDKDGTFICYKSDYNPSGKGEQAMELVKVFEMTVVKDYRGKWISTVMNVTA